MPFFGVTNMGASLRFYVDGLGFTMKQRWIPNPAERNPDGRIRWCWLQLGEAAIMLQEYLPEHRPKETLGTARITWAVLSSGERYRPAPLAA